MQLKKFVGYLNENRLKFCDVHCWVNLIPCEKCLFILTLYSLAVDNKHQKLHYMFENPIFRNEFTEIYRKRFLKENKEANCGCCII